MKIVLCHGCFDLLTIGHVRHLREARKFIAVSGGELIVSITSDAFVAKGSGRPIMKQELRLEMLRELRCVDRVILSNGPDALPIIESYQPAFYVKGREYWNNMTTELFREKAAVEAYGGQLVFTDTVESHTTDLVKRLRLPPCNGWIGESSKDGDAPCKLCGHPAYVHQPLTYPIDREKVS